MICGPNPMPGLLLCHGNLRFEKVHMRKGYIFPCPISLALRLWNESNSSSRTDGNIRNETDHAYNRCLIKKHGVEFL